MRPRDLVREVDLLLGHRPGPDRREKAIMDLLVYLASDPEPPDGMSRAESDLLETLALRLYEGVRETVRPETPTIVLEVGPRPLYVVLASRPSDAQRALRVRSLPIPPPSDL